MLKGFAAYPSGEPQIEASIRETSLNNSKQKLDITPWPKLSNIGLKLDQLIRDKINEVDFLLADITVPNFNVYYEIGFAIARRKPVIPLVNTTYADFEMDIELTGLFDTIGQLRYQNSNDLTAQLSMSVFKELGSLYLKERNHSQPLFVVLPLRKPEYINYIMSSINSTMVEFRQFDPEETGRMYTAAAIGHVSASAGIIVPLLPKKSAGSFVHNLYGAFVAGVAHGLGQDPLLLQFDDSLVSLDYREFVRTARIRREIEQEIEDYCKKTLVNNQRTDAVRPRKRRSLLEQIDLGSSAAENEYKRLDQYFVATAQFSRALRADNAIVVGRKGSGKSAIYFTILDLTIKDKRNLVIDLNPSSHHLTKLREELLKVISEGVFDHTMAAFWQYILYIEIILKIREALLPAARFDLSLLSRIEALETRFQLKSDLVSGDFTTRLNMVIDGLIEKILSAPREEDIRPLLTNMLFEDEIPSLREAVVNLGNDFDKIVVLFDNLDKGWPARGIELHDVRTLRHLIDALNKIGRDLNKKRIDLKHLMFLRSDVYELLVDETSDRGKYNPILIDWSDPEQLRRVIEERISASVAFGAEGAAILAANPEIREGVTAFDAMLHASLMRPRFLIDIYEKAIVFAINRGRDHVDKKDVDAALAEHSRHLVGYMGLELRDVSGISADVLRRFRGSTGLLTNQEVMDILSSTGDEMAHADPGKLKDLLLWYGFLGFADMAGHPKFIYDLNYNMNDLLYECSRQGTDILYVINKAFSAGLEIAT